MSAPIPPAASTRPSPPAPPWMWFLTTNGISTNTGPRKNTIDSVTASSVSDSQRNERT